MESNFNGNTQIWVTRNSNLKAYKKQPDKTKGSFQTSSSRIEVTENRGIWLRISTKNIGKMPNNPACKTIVSVAGACMVASVGYYVVRSFINNKRDYKLYLNGLHKTSKITRLTKWRQSGRH